MKRPPKRNQPPRSTRFRKGQSGNPKGRPRKPCKDARSAFDVVIDKTLTIIQDGKPRTVTVEEALQHKTLQKAFAGDRTAQRTVWKMNAKREKAIAKRTPAETGYGYLCESVDPTNADEALLLLSIACRDPDQVGHPDERQPLLLERWAVESALCRRAARRMNGHDIKDAKDCTRDADRVRWPEPNDQ